jgi:hypothetical protein
LRGGADDFIVAADRFALPDIGQRHLVALRHEVAKLQAAGKAGLGRQAEIVDHDRHIVVGVEPDVARLVGLRRRSSLLKLFLLAAASSCTEPGPI